MQIGTMRDRDGNLLRKDYAMTAVTITIVDDYPAELRDRLTKAGISLGALSRATGIDRAQIARLFNKPVHPRLDTAVKIERAIAKLLARKGARSTCEEEPRCQLERSGTYNGDDRSENFEDKRRELDVI
jgi:hypothetical protein